MYPFDILSQDSLEIDDILSSIDNLTQYEEQQIELCNTINKPDLESVRKDMEEKGFVDSQIQEALTGLEQNLCKRLLQLEADEGA